MSQPERFEILVLGSGAGGKLLAWHMARAGRRTAVVERRYIGGSCPNINCMPSKNEIWSAKVSHLVRHAVQFGTSITGSATVVAGRGGVIRSSSCDRDPDHLPQTESHSGSREPEKELPKLDVAGSTPVARSC